MLILIDEDYERKILSKNSLNQNEIDAFSLLFNSAVEEKNLIKASYDFFEFIKKHYDKKFSSQVRIYLQNILSSYSTLMSDIPNIAPVLTISDTTSSGNLSLNCCPRISSANLPRLLFGSLYCENITDCIFYNKLFDKLSKNKHNIYLDKETFGGGTAKGVVENLLNEEEKVFFCIADSDKKYSGDSLGSTANSLNSLYISKRHTFSALYILKVHEKENLLPYKLLEKSGCFSREQQELLRLLSISTDDIKDYFDVKEGISKKCRSQMKKDPCLNAINSSIKTKMQRKKMYHSKKGDKKLVLGIGNNGAENAINSLVSYEHFMDLLTPKQKSDLETIFEQMLRFGLANRFTYI